MEEERFEWEKRHLEQERLARGVRQAHEAAQRYETTQYRVWVAIIAEGCLVIQRGWYDEHVYVGGYGGPSQCAAAAGAALVSTAAASRA